MNKIFAAYFRILKQNKSRVELLAPVLEGLAKFAHMINVEFFDDLIKSLLNLIIVGVRKRRIKGAKLANLHLTSDPCLITDTCLVISYVMTDSCLANLSLDRLS